MANITNVIADSSGFIPQTWALEALNVLRKQIVLMRLIATDSDYQEKGWLGKALNIPYPGTFTAQDKVVGNAVTAQAPTGGGQVTLTLSKHKVVDFLVEDYAAAQASSDLLTRYIEPAIIALVEQVESDIFSLATQLTTTPVGTAGTNLGASTLQAARKTLNQQKAPQQDRFIVFSTKDEVALLGDSSLQNFFAFAQANSIKEGMPARLYGMDSYMSQYVDGNANTNIVQTVTISGTPTGGTFTLTFNGQTTAAIAYNAAAAAVQAALVALSSVGTGNATVTGSGPYTVTFSGPAANYPPLMTGNGAALTGGTSPSVAVAAAASTTATYNLALHKNAFLMASRPFADIPAGSGVATATVTDPMSGITLRVLKQYNPQYRAEYVGFDILYGLVCLRPSQGVVLLS